MAILETARERLIALLSVAVVILLVRVGADEYGAPDAVDTALYVLALACLVGCLFVIMQDRR